MRIAILAQDLYLTATGGCIDADDLLVTAQFAHRNHERHEVNVEPALGILARRTKLQEIEYGKDIPIETIVTLPCKREVTVAQVLDRLCCVTIQLSLRGDAVLRGIVPVVALIIKRSGNALIVRRNGTSSKQRTTVVLAMVHFSDGIRLHQVLSGVPDIVNDAKVRLQDCVPVPERRVKRELVAQRGSASSYVATGGNADLIEHVVIEVVLFGPMPGSSCG